MKSKRGTPNLRAEERFASNVFLMLGFHRASMSELAIQSGLSTSTVSRILSAARTYEYVRPETLESIAFALNVDLKVLRSVDLRERFDKLLRQLERTRK